LHSYSIIIVIMIIIIKCWCYVKGVSSWHLFVGRAGSCYDPCKCFALPMLSCSL